MLAAREAGAGAKVIEGVWRNRRSLDTWRHRHLRARTRRKAIRDMGRGHGQR